MNEGIMTRQCPWCKKDKSIQFDYSLRGKQCRECLAKYRKKYALSYGIKSTRGWSSRSISGENSKTSVYRWK